MAKLYLVGTPIGNLEDITIRATKTLEFVDVIACEDTRVTLKLLNALGISHKKLITYNNFNEKNGSKGILKLIQENNLNVALVSDAGMPIVSDPGFEVLRQAKSAGVEFELIPGVSAVTTAFALSSLSNTFTFCGFIKDKSQQRINSLSKLTEGTYIYFVSPHKILNVLTDITTVFQGQESIFLAKELTKMYEEFFEGTAQNIFDTLSQREVIKGEFTLVLKIPKIKRNKYAN
ncbi:16S rRNA (cytidine(1402)-2'-O)-methyltransferase [Mycoplasmopsis pullorum]|uniref:16S rRNA (cytidine(1402)-2'-O)-methyltransferase n=1 Tax=Mycoplasmopsis pullorum TaxID=48003 RepID=UPI0011180548|nr:16S rRNA (cytidine(1402)-2'-O)-methyltransferase [Mycoplasmopsis pullorum]TNK83091.1 16S rRNA (cytidine(1402)-2'-O)-methyltransferase [Mycoplasmopsis pullorum]TNK91840.1 16S rRNA (cytidine(1402)-2'-O)-methyltransferase [Mycoplasmopsis pullorum]